MNNGLQFDFCAIPLWALPSGGLWWPDVQVLCVSDLHLGKSDRIARRTGAMLPPYETTETLDKLATLIDQLEPQTVICLGDSFDDLAAADSLDVGHRLTLARLQAGRRWVWIEGNHDPGPVEFGGDHLEMLNIEGLVFRHIADPTITGEISGHYHPKVQVPVRGRHISRPSFLVDQTRIILPAFGAYTGGLRCTDPVLQGLMKADAHAILTGKTSRMVPMPRVKNETHSRQL